MPKYARITASSIYDYYRQLSINGYLNKPVTQAVLALTFINDAYDFLNDDICPTLDRNVEEFMMCLRRKHCFLNEHIVNG